MSAGPDRPKPDGGSSAERAEGGFIAEFAEDEYLYGIGILRLRIIRVTLLRSDPGWALVDGIHIDHRGDPHERRNVLVTVAALRRYSLGRS